MNNNSDDYAQIDTARFGGSPEASEESPETGWKPFVSAGPAAHVVRLHESLVQLPPPLALQRQHDRQSFLPDVSRPPLPPLYLLHENQPNLIALLVGAWAECLTASNPQRAHQVLKALGGVNKFFVREADSLQGRLVPLKPLPLMPWPSSASLWMLLATRLFEVVESILGAELDQGDWQYAYREAEPLRQAMRHVQGCIACGWESNLQDRAGQLDPEAYAIESVEAERFRESAPRAWAEFLDVLALETFRMLRHSTDIRDDFRFVLPVTEVDYNPSVREDLFRLFRVIRHPRLIFLLGASVLDAVPLHETGLPWERFGAG